MTNEQIDQQIHKVADQILARLGKQCDGDSHVGIAALAVAMCSLARADGTPLSEIERVVSIAHQEVSSVESEQ